MKRVAIVALALLMMGATAAPALAQSNVGSPLGFVGVSGSNTSHVKHISVTASVPFNFYIWSKVDFGHIGQPAQNSSNGLKGWELSISIPSSLFLLGAAQLNPPAALNVGSFPNFNVGTGSNLNASASTGVALATFQALATVPVTNIEITLGGAAVSSIQPAKPLWLEWLTTNGCTNPVTSAPTNCLRYFANAGKLVINGPVANDETSVGTLKSNYR